MDTPVAQFPGGLQLYDRGAYYLLSSPSGDVRIAGGRYAALKILLESHGEIVDSQRLVYLYASHDSMRSSMLALRRRGIPVHGIRYAGYVLDAAVESVGADLSEARSKPEPSRRTPPAKPTDGEDGAPAITLKRR